MLKGEKGKEETIKSGINYLWCSKTKRGNSNKQ